VQFYAGDQDRGYVAQQPALPDTNYGLNSLTDPTLLVQSIPFEVSQVLLSLNVVPQIPETRTFRNTRQRDKDASRFLRVNSEL
jgi:hypothetical protein